MLSVSTDDTKKSVINAIARSGNRKVAIDELRVTYLDFEKWLSEDLEFHKQVKQAEKFYIVNLNKVIANLAKKQLFDILSKGLVEVVTKTLTRENPDGELDVQTVIERRNKGVPAPYIKMGLDLIPDLLKSAETLMGYNALHPEQLEALESELNGFESRLRDAMSGDRENQVMTDEMIGTIQNILLNG